MRQTDLVTESWDLRPDLANLLSAGKALLPSVPATPAAIVRTATSRLLGKRVTSKVGEHEVELTITELDYEAGTFDLASGRLGDVRIVVEDVSWPDTPVQRVVVVARNVRYRSLPSLTAYPASVELTISIAEDVLRERVTEAAPSIVPEIDDDGGLRARWAKHPDWGHVEITARVVDQSVVLEPTTVQIRSKRLRPPRRMRPVVLPLTDLPDGLTLTAVESAPGELILHTVAEQWPDRIASIPLPDLLAWLTNAALTLRLPRLWR